MICHDYKCIFVHIPKNAGQSIEHVFINLVDLTWETRAPLLLRQNNRPELGPPKLAHLKADQYVRFKYLTQKMYDEYFKFTIVRNPWSRAVSIYKHFGFNSKVEFTDFIKGVFQTKLLIDMGWFVGPQSNFIYSDTGDLLVDYIGRFENLQNSFNEICEHIGLSEGLMPHVNKSIDVIPTLNLNLKYIVKNLLHKKNKENQFGNNLYQDYYDQESIDIVAKIYKKDIELFCYDFEK
jgi:hypothetical protein